MKVRKIELFYFWTLWRKALCDLQLPLAIAHGLYQCFSTAGPWHQLYRAQVLKKKEFTEQRSDRGWEQLAYTISHPEILLKCVCSPMCMWTSDKDA
jgi:hypothetical protein